MSKEKSKLNLKRRNFLTGTATLAGIAGSIQANEVIKSILNIGKPLRNEIMIFNSLDLSFRKVKLNKNSNCKNHLHVLHK